MLRKARFLKQTHISDVFSSARCQQRKAFSATSASPSSRLLQEAKDKPLPAEKQSNNMIAAIDQGTTSTRVMLYKFLKNQEDEESTIVQEETGAKDLSFQLFNSSQKPHKSIFPHPGWVEQDPMEILNNTIDCIESVFAYKDSQQNAEKVYGIGITNQRETTVLWDKVTGKPLHNAIVWNDLRTNGLVAKLSKELDQEKIRDMSGLPISTYFSALKLRWLIENVEEVKEAVKSNRCMFGTIDTWLIWNLTGGVNGGIHATDVTNASRTMLMNLNTLKWDPELFELMGIPQTGIQFPEIKTCAEVYGYCNSGSAKGIPITGCVGDQQSATIGQRCFHTGEAKNTYGTGCFLLMNIGEKVVHSKNGLLTTVCYQFPGEAPVYALEGSVAVAGSGIEWLKQNMGLISDVSELEPLASSVNNTGGVYFVPAFSGLFAPHWRSDARGVIVGLTLFSTKAHIVRAYLESVCLQTRDIIEAMQLDAAMCMTKLHVDGGMSNNDFIMQMQADILGVPVMRPVDKETTVMGAAICAAVGAGLFKNVHEVPEPHSKKFVTTFEPSSTEEERKKIAKGWNMAIEKSLNSEMNHH